MFCDEDSDRKPTITFIFSNTTKWKIQVYCVSILTFVETLCDIFFSICMNELEWPQLESLKELNG